MEGENSAILDFHVLQKVGNQLQVFIVADEPGIAPNIDQPHVFGAADEGIKRAAVLSYGPPARLQIDNQRLRRHPFGNRRQIRRKPRRLLEFKSGHRPADQGSAEEDPRRK
ncbi:hypothetical protein GCM10009077_34450 [Roseibium denhamense]